MAESIIPDDLGEFILRHIDTVAELEALLLLRGNPEVEWSAGETSKRLYIDEAAAAATLERLCAAGLLGHNAGRYRYHGLPEDTARMVDRLADAYARHLVPVTNLIHRKPRQIRAFADAFRLKKDR
jgi:hypothetical protein